MFLMLTSMYSGYHGDNSVYSGYHGDISEIMHLNINSISCQISVCST